MRIYVANLREYNEGKLVGEWIDLPNDDLQERLDIICSNGEDYAIHDYETSYGIEIQENSNLFELNELAEELEVLNSEQQIAFEAYLDGVEGSYAEALEVVRAGNYTLYADCSNMKEVAYRVIDGSGRLDNADEILKSFFDYERYGRELDLTGTFIPVGKHYVEIYR